MKAYFELLDHPDIKIAYTPTEESANISNTPKETSVRTWETPKGVIAQTSKLKVKAKIGAKKYKNKLTWLGIIISLENSFNPSARGCSKP